MVALIVRVTFIMAATAAYFGLAILGWGGPGAFFSHPALIALAVAVFALAGAALFAGGNLSPGVREDRGNRWVIAALSLIGVLAAFLPALTDRKEFWTLDGDAIRWLGVVLFVAGGALRLWPVVVLGKQFSGLAPGTRWSPAASMASSATPAIWGCSSTRWGGRSPFVRGSACCSRRSSSRCSSRASARKRGCCTHSSALSTMLTGPARHG